MKDIGICKKCLNELTEYGEAILLLYEEMCLARCRNQIYLVRPYEVQKIEVFKFLEQKRFVVTTEDRKTKGNIVVKPLGYSYLGEGVHRVCHLEVYYS